MSYAAGVGGAKASTIYPCGHMAYYDSGSAPSIICPICGARHQNANIMQLSGGYSYQMQPQPMMSPQIAYSSNNTNIAFTQATVQIADGGLAAELKYPDLAWLDREVSRYTKR